MTGRNCSESACICRSVARDILKLERNIWPALNGKVKLLFRLAKWFLKSRIINMHGTICCGIKELLLDCTDGCERARVPRSLTPICVDITSFVASCIWCANFKFSPICSTTESNAFPIYSNARSPEGHQARQLFRKKLHFTSPFDKLRYRYEDAEDALFIATYHDSPEFAVISTERVPPIVAICRVAWKGNDCLWHCCGSEDGRLSLLPSAVFVLRGRNRGGVGE